MFKVKLYRYMIRMMTFALWRRLAPRNLQVVNRAIRIRDAEIGARIYTPESPGPHPVIIYYHGGGFVLGDLDTVDGICRAIAASSDHTVVSVDYRLAPESPFPAAAHDAIDAVQWVREHAGELEIDIDRLYVAGDSAGGNLAAVVALHMKDIEPRLIKGQILIYPVTHHYSYGTPSYTEKARGAGLTRNMMVWFWDLYYKGNQLLPEGEVTHPLSTPLAAEQLAGVPPALVLTAEHDPLRDEGILYAEKMAAAGSQVQHTLYDEAQHGFIGSMGPTADHKEGIQEISQWLAGNRQHQ